MAHVDPEDFGDRELARIFMTPKLREASRAEAALDAHGIDYFVRAEPFGRTLFGLPRTGATFYVAAEQADACANILGRAGLARGVVPRDLTAPPAGEP
jgi:hypothetical protein